MIVPKRLVEPELQLWATHNHVNPVSGIRAGNITLLTSGQACNTYLRLTNGRAKHAQKHKQHGLTSDEK